MHRHMCVAPILIPYPGRIRGEYKSRLFFLKRKLSVDDDDVTGTELGPERYSRGGVQFQPGTTHNISLSLFL